MIKLLSVVLLACLVLLTACGPSLPEGVTAIAPARAVDFTLASHTGEQQALHDLQGQWVMLAFGYTHCPDVCPITLAEMRLIQNELNERNLPLKLAFVSVDGERDTPEALANYLSYFRADVVGFSSSGDAAAQTVALFDGRFTLNNANGLREEYTVDHTASKFLINPSGQWVRTYAYALSTDAVVEDAAQLIGAA
jgi:protein SCO1